MPLVDLSPLLQERVVCSIAAAVKYEVPANMLLAVAEKEGGKPGQWVRNANGTHDVGPMQFNTAYFSGLGKYGITAANVAQAGCYPFDLAAWRLRGHIRNDEGDLWTRAANYHSRTPQYNAAYRADLVVKALKWADWLEARFVTYDMAKPAPSTAVAPENNAKLKPSPPVRVAQQPLLRPGTRLEYVPRKILVDGQ
jgi:Transglycosylase SLT domain